MTWCIGPLGIRGTSQADNMVEVTKREYEHCPESSKEVCFVLPVSVELMSAGLYYWQEVTDELVRLRKPAEVELPSDKLESCDQGIRIMSNLLLEL